MVKEDIDKIAKFFATGDEENLNDVKQTRDVKALVARYKEIRYDMEQTENDRHIVETVKDYATNIGTYARVVLEENKDRFRNIINRRKE